MNCCKAREGDCNCPPNRKECKALFAEFIGMTLFVFIGVGSAHMQFRGGDSDGTDTSLLLISLAFGFGITSIVSMTAGASGGHLNPAVTFCLMSLQEISVGLGFLYVLMQMAGACLGAVLAALADPYRAGFAVNVVQAHYCGEVISRGIGNVTECCLRFDCNIAANEGTAVYDTSEDIDAYTATLNTITTPSGPFKTDTLMWGSAVVVELVGTYMLCLVVLMTVVYKESKADKMAPLAIGLSVFFAHIIAIPITNCSINPARSFGAAVAASIFPWYDEVGGELVLSSRIIQAWEQMIFFWAVPIAGGLLASLSFWGMFLEVDNADKTTGYDLNPVESNRGEGQGPQAIVQENESLMEEDNKSNLTQRKNSNDSETVNSEKSINELEMGQVASKDE
jgi:glycerol uptake facilitator-like aquaporin